MTIKLTVQIPSPRGRIEIGEANFGEGACTKSNSHNPLPEIFGAALENFDPPSRGGYPSWWKKLVLFLMAISALILPVTSHALTADQESRARMLGGEIRCAVCEAQSVNDSDATMAADFRRLIRERIAAGDSDQQVRDYLAKRYGDYILLRPPVQANTLLLWLLPVGILAVAGLFVLVLIRARSRRSS